MGVALVVEMDVVDIGGWDQERAAQEASCFEMVVISRVW
jgi:hypothetical protein